MGDGAGGGGGVKKARLPGLEDLESWVPDFLQSAARNC